MIHYEGTFCKKDGHNQQPIRYLCLEPTCASHRLLCHLCVRDAHRKHTLANLDKYIDPLARLGMNTQHPARLQALQSLQHVTQSLRSAFDNMKNLVATQAETLEGTLIYQLITISHTFSEDMVEQASAKMSNGEAKEEEIEEYVRMINMLGKKDFNDPEKLLEALGVINKTVAHTIQQITRKMDNLMTQFQFRLKKLNLSQHSLDQIIQHDTNPAQRYLFPQIPTVRLKQHHNPTSPLPEATPSLPQKKKRPVKVLCIKEPQSIICDSAQRDSWSDQPKIQEDTITPMNEVRIGVQQQDGIVQMKQQARLRIKRVTVGFCRKPQSQLANILSLPNLEELEINWYELAKKQFLIKIINNLTNLKSLVLNCANEFDEECCRMVPKKLTKIRKLQYGWDFLNALRDYDQGIYFRLSPYTNRGCPLKTSITRQMVVGLKRLQNVWLGDFMYFRPSNNQIPFKNIKQFTLGQTKGKYFRIPQKLCVQLKDMRQLLSLAILHVRIDERKLHPILLNNPFIKTFLIEGCDDISDQSLKILAKNCNLTHLSIRQSTIIQGTPIWDMHNLSTLILVQCQRVKPQQAIKGLPKMRYLTYLNLYGNKWVTDEIVQQIPNTEKFQSLNLGRTAITDRALIEIGDMLQLKALCLDCNPLTGLNIAKLAEKLPGMQKLSLWGLNGQLQSGNINDYDMQTLAKQLVCLYHLSIRYCKQLSPQAFLQFKSLRFLETDRENLSLEVQEELQKRGVKILCDLEKLSIEEV